MDKLENIRHHGMILISATRIGLRTVTSCHKHSGKDEEKSFRSLVAVSTLHKLECITVICKWNCKWPYQGMFSSCNIGSVNFVLVLKLTPVLFWTRPA